MGSCLLYTSVRHAAVKSDCLQYGGTGSQRLHGTDRGLSLIHIFPEPDNFTSANLEEVADRLDRSLKKFICEYMKMDKDALVEKRYRRFRRM